MAVHADFCEQLAGAIPLLGFRHLFFVVNQRKRDILFDREPGKKRAVLKHHGSIGTGRDDGGTAGANVATRRRVESRDEI